ncbi:serine/threonine-protein kinase AfsK-like [Schistocerca nitens]|uniref:serine/threonine-protein kinase AfsK-like n=1 Tax=Schistocerca nitens TaxID=7011 RepID=UPI002119381E|nr:serine/threonine-protein kinase AfsK-like [Schistocerca nitens]
MHSPPPPRRARSDGGGGGAGSVPEEARFMRCPPGAPNLPECGRDPPGAVPNPNPKPLPLTPGDVGGAVQQPVGGGGARRWAAIDTAGGGAALRRASRPRPGVSRRLPEVPAPAAAPPLSAADNPVAVTRYSSTRADRF